MLGTIEGTRVRGRQRIKLSDGIKMFMGCKNLQKWRNVIANVNVDMTRWYSKDNLTAKFDYFITVLHLEQAIKKRFIFSWQRWL